MIDFSQFVVWAFYGLISFAFFRIDKNLTDLSKSIGSLNLLVAVEIQKNNAIKEEVHEVREKCKEINHRLVALENVISICKIKRSEA